MHVRFSQSCPTCGRRVEISAALLGRTVACQHCQAEFVANVNDQSFHGSDHDQQLMDRVEKVLAKAAIHAAAAASGDHPAQPIAKTDAASQTGIA